VLDAEDGELKRGGIDPVANLLDSNRRVRSRLFESRAPYELQVGHADEVN